MSIFANTLTNQKNLSLDNFSIVEMCDNINPPGGANIITDVTNVSASANANASANVNTNVTIANASVTRVKPFVGVTVDNVANYDPIRWNTTANKSTGQTTTYNSNRQTAANNSRHQTAVNNLDRQNAGNMFNIIVCWLMSVVIFVTVLIFGVIHHKNMRDDAQNTIDKINKLIKPFTDVVESCEFQLHFMNESHLQFNTTADVLFLGHYDCNRVKNGLQYACVTNTTFINDCRYSINYNVLPEKIIVKYNTTINKYEREIAGHEILYWFSLIVVILSGLFVLIPCAAKDTRR